MIIAVDFDGTCVTHEYPLVGKELPACARTLRALAKAGHQLILYTMRSGGELQDAVAWCEERKIPLWGVNENPEQKTWTTSPKVYAHLYIDDSALGCPLVRPPLDRPFVNWLEIAFRLRAMNVLPSKDEVTL